jgi:hypothetical protein
LISANFTAGREARDVLYGAAWAGRHRTLVAERVVALQA